MNVWIVNHYAIPPSMGGLVRHYYFSKYLQEKGHTVKIFTSSKIHNTNINMIKDKSLYREEIEEGVQYTFVRSRDYKGNGLDRILNLADFPFKTWRTMKVFLKNQRPDIIYTSSPDIFVAFFALIFGKKNKIPVVVEVRDLWPQSIVEYNGISQWNPVIQMLYRLEKWIYKNADKLIFTMPGGKEYIKDKKWKKVVNFRKIYHINNGVDLQEFEHNQKEYSIQDSDLLDDTTFKVVYMGSIRKVNHLQDLVEAAKFLKDDKRISILIYGDGTERKELEEQCKKDHLNIKFKGQVEKKYIPYILGKSDLNLINVQAAGINKYGCSWNKLFEYMASGKPILCNLPVAYDLIRERKLGISKRFSNGKEYSDGIRLFANMDEKQYMEYCENAKCCAKEYDYRKLSDRVEEILKMCI